MSLRLEDIELIRRLKHRYFRSIDTRDVEALTEIFRPDASIRYIGGSYDFQAEGRDNIVGALKAAFHNRFASIHAGFCEEINVHTDTAAEGIWYLSDWALDLNTKLETVGSSIYRDKYVKVDGKWQIQHSGYRRVYEQVQTLKELPNITAHYLGGGLPKP
jgi:hypothetical protein